jgi:cytochrome c-type biogenesis protein CcmF
VRVWASTTCFALSAFVFTTVGQELVRGAQVRKGATGTDILTAMIGLVGRSRRRYGGYIVHLGIVLIFIGFAGQGFKKDEQVQLKVGQQTTVGGFTVRHDALAVTNDAQKQMITGHVTVFRNGQDLGTMEPARWYFVKHEEEPTTEVAIRRAPAEDLYIVLAGFDAKTQAATYAITVNPLVDWIWFGFAVMALGTGLALLPETAFAFAAAKVPAVASSAATTSATTSILILLLLLPASVRAQSSKDVQVLERSATERQLEGEILCTCGCRRSLKDCGMPNCQGHAAQTAKMRQLLSEGKDHDAVVAAFIHDFGGQDILSAPVDKGFNRLAWFFPYLIGATGAASVAVVAFRWSRREAATDAALLPPQASDDPDLRAKLDDELRDLD